MMIREKNDKKYPVENEKNNNKEVLCTITNTYTLT
jgi:hypothetical protein